MSLRSLFLKKQRQACHRKVKIRSEKMARQTAATMTRADGGAPTEWYRCETCGGFHVGHPSVLADLMRGPVA